MVLRVRGIAAMAILLAAVISGPALAGFKPKVTTDSSGKTGTVYVNGKVAIRFHTSNGTLSAGERAVITGQRLTDLIAAGLSPYGLSVKGDKWQGRVVAGDKMLCVATRKDAKLGGTTALDMASSWVANIRTQMLLPAISVDDIAILVPLGESRSIAVGGVATGPISAQVDNAEVAKAAISEQARRVEFVGQKLGETDVDISVEGEHARVHVVVKKYAGRVPEISFAQVTGKSCPTTLIDYAARQAVMLAATLEPGSRLETGSVDFQGGALGFDKSRRVLVDLKISGEGYIPYSVKAAVEVDNIAMPSENVQQLFYSNDPESLLKYQTLFAGKLSLDKSTRLLFHHQNAMGKRAHFLVDLINPNPTSATFRVFRGVSRPLIDTVVVGYIASSAFIKDYTNDVSVIETVPAQSRLIMVSDLLSQNDTTSGVLEMRQMSGDPAYIRVSSLPPGQENVARGDITPVPNPTALAMSDQVYPSPIKNVAAEYVVGQRWAFIPIGKHAVTEASTQKKLYGNYGVTYNISVKVTNPTAETKKVSVVFDPTAGLASGVFMIDGAFVATKYAKPPAEISLVTYQLKPGEERNINVLTLPVAGSNYPATLVVRS